MSPLATIRRDSNSKNLMRRGTLDERAVSRLSAVLRPLLIALLALAVLPAAASAAVINIEITPKGGADYGETHSVTGKMTGPYGARWSGGTSSSRSARIPTGGGSSGPSPRR